MTVESLHTSRAGLQNSRRGGWRTVLVGAVLSALILVIGFGVGARPTPARTPSVNVQRALPLGPVTVQAAPVSGSGKSVAQPPLQSSREPRVRNSGASVATESSEDEAGDQEIVVRQHRKSTPTAKASRVKHYSDDE